MNENSKPFTGPSLAIQRLQEQLHRQTRLSFPLLLVWERGSGKKRAARALYETDSWTSKAFWRFDLSDPEFDLPTSAEMRGEEGFFLLEELGNATVAVQDRCWRWLRELGPELQNSRLVSTSQVPLGPLVAAKRFRADLYLRLRANVLETPALRERKEDIPFLVRDFLEEAARESGESPKMFTAEAMDWIFEFSWPGNVAQLRAETMRAVFATPGNVIPREVLQPDFVLPEDSQPDLFVRESLPLPVRLEEYERNEILSAMKEVGGIRERAAQRLGIDRRTLQRKLRRLKNAGQLEEKLELNGRVS